MTRHRAPRRRWWRGPRPVVRYSTPEVTIEVTGHRPAAAQRLLDAALLRAVDDVRPWRPEDGDTRCQHCGRPNPVWTAPDNVWNAVMGDDGGVLCPPCFIARAEKTGLTPPSWRVAPRWLIRPGHPTPPDKPDPLPNPTTPSL